MSLSWWKSRLGVRCVRRDDWSDIGQWERITWPPIFFRFKRGARMLFFSEIDGPFPGGSSIHSDAVFKFPRWPVLFLAGDEVVNVFFGGLNKWAMITLSKCDVVGLRRNYSVWTGARWAAGQWRVFISTTTGREYFLIFNFNWFKVDCVRRSIYFGSRGKIVTDWREHRLLFFRFY